MSEAGWRQFHVAETEKYAHVTYFFNGGRRDAVAGRGAPADPEPEGRDLRSRAGDVARSGVTDALVAAIESGALRLHRRQLRQPRHGRPHRRLGRDVAGARGIDACLARVVDGDRARSRPRTRTARAPLLAITADHGNADDLRDDAGEPVTAHSLNPVPFLLLGRAVAARRLRDGVLADVAPTLLELAGPAALARPSPVVRCWRPASGRSAPSVIASAAVRTEVLDS